MEYKTLCVSLYEDPGFLEELVEIAVDFDVRAIDRMAKTGVDAMVLLVDYGASAHGLLRPQQFKAIYKPGLKRSWTASKQTICRCSNTTPDESTIILMLGWKSASWLTILCSVLSAWTSPGNTAIIRIKIWQRKSRVLIRIMLHIGP